MDSHHLPAVTTARRDGFAGDGLPKPRVAIQRTRAADATRIVQPLADQLGRDRAAAWVRMSPGCSCVGQRESAFGARAGATLVADGKASTSRALSAPPGTYVVRAIANDGALATRERSDGYCPLIDSKPGVPPCRAACRPEERARPRAASVLCTSARAASPARRSVDRCAGNLRRCGAHLPARAAVPIPATAKSADLLDGEPRSAARCGRTVAGRRSTPGSRGSRTGGPRRAGQKARRS